MANEKDELPPFAGPLMHPSMFEYLKPTDDQLVTMASLRIAAKDYAEHLDRALPYGPYKTHVLRQLRALAMWVNVAITRGADGSPRNEVDRGG